MRLRVFFRNLLRRSSVERELDAELRSYRELVEDEARARGLAPAAARRAARLEVGSVDAVKDAVRDVRSGARVEQLVQDASYAFRMMRRTPAFAAVIVLTLALGIGTATAIFTVVNAVLLRPLPFADPDRLLWLEDVSYTGEFVELQRRARTFDVASYAGRQVTITGDGEPLRASAAAVSPNFMQLLGARAEAGRPILPGDERTAEGDVVVISARFWRSRFGADPRVVGRTIPVDGTSRRIVGIMDAGLSLPVGAQLWMPDAIDEGDRIRLWSTSRSVVARLREGSTVGDADAELKVLAPSMRSLFPWSMPAGYGTTVAAVPLREALVSDVAPMLLMLMASVLVLLLIAAVNVSNLLVARTTARTSELAVRASLGAPRGRILRQVLTEAMVLLLAGVVASLPVAFAGVGALLAWLPAGLPRPVDLAVDRNLLAFGALLIVVTAAVIGTLPALRVSRADLVPRLAHGSRHSPGRQARRASDLLVAAQVTLAVSLVITAILLVRSLGHLQSLSPGFVEEGIVTARITPPAHRFTEGAARRALFASLLERVGAVPGVANAALSDRVPFSGDIYGSVFIIEGRPDPARTGEWPLADVSAVVSPGFFSTLGLSLIAGRPFTEADTESAQRVAIISQSLARTYWPDESPIGRRLSFPGDPTGRTIVGVVGDVKWARVTEAGQRALFVPVAQASPAAMRLVLRTARDAETVLAHVSSILRDLDRETPIDAASTLQASIARSNGGTAFPAWVVTIFAAAGLLLGAVGIYGTVSDQVSSRRHEIGVRLALGARRTDIFGSVVGGTFRAVAAGALVGLVAAAVLTRALRSMLVGVTPGDPLTFAAAAGVLVLTAVISAWLPARRAAALDPLVVLKVE